MHSDNQTTIYYPEWNLGDLNEWVNDSNQLTKETYIEVSGNKYRFVIYRINDETFNAFIIDPNHISNRVIAFAEYSDYSHELCGVIVDSLYHRKGVGTAFIKEILKSLNVTNLMVYEDNTPALKIYMRCGFTPKSTKQTKTGDTIILMGI